MGTRFHHHRRRGFTLIEAALVTVIIGVGVMGMLQLLAAGTMSNASNAELTTATNLAANVREATLRTSYDDIITTFRNQTFSPPVDARLTAISGLDNWSQQVQVQYVDPFLLTLNVPDTQPEKTARVTVTVNHHDRPVYTLQWVIADSN